MRALLTIETLVAAPPQFKREEILDVLFSQRAPIWTGTPFKNLPIRTIQNLSVSFSLQTLPDAVKGPLDVLSQVLYKEELQWFPPWCINELYRCYSKQVSSWRTFFYSEIEAVCTLPTSKFYWTLLQHGGIEEVFPKRPLSVEQQMWLYYQDTIQQQTQNKFWMDFRDSLLPWLNPKMYKDWQESKKNTRVNTNYEAQRRAMIDGTLSLQLPEEDTKDWDVIK